MNFKTWAARHPIFAYIVLTMMWSFGFWSCLFLFMKPGDLLKSPPPISFLFVMLGGFGPTFGSLLTTWMVYGREGLQALWDKLRIRRVGVWWFALLVIPAVTALTPLLRWMAGYPVDTDAMVNLLGPGIALGLTIGLMEEIGWRGFLLPHLLKHHNPTVATLLLGLIWGGIWHGYADYFGLGGRGLVSLALIVLLAPILLTAWSFIITWVYERTQGSLLIAYLMHASLSSSALIFGQTYTNTTEELIWTTISSGIAILAAVFIWLFIRRAESYAPQELRASHQKI